MIDRSTYAQHRRLQDLRLPCRSEYCSLLDDFYASKVEAQLVEYGPTLRLPLPEKSRILVNDCLAEIDGMVTAKLKDSAPSAQSRAREVLGFRLQAGATLQELFERDSFHSVLPFLDGPAMRLLVEPSGVPDALAGELRDTIRHRVLHGPQRTRYIFLHELAVGYYLNELEAGGVVPSRRDLDLHVTRYAALPALTLSSMAASSGIPVGDLAALHFETDAEIERRLPLFFRDWSLAAAHLYFALEPLMLYRWKRRNGLIIERVLQFFCLPSLERFEADRSLVLTANAGQRVEEQLLLKLYGDGPDTVSDEANEIDVIRCLVELSRDLWEPSAQA
jgi:hypothetical protein